MSNLFTSMARVFRCRIQRVPNGARVQYGTQIRLSYLNTRLRIVFSHLIVVFISGKRAYRPSYGMSKFFYLHIPPSHRQDISLR